MNLSQDTFPSPKLIGGTRLVGLGRMELVYFPPTGELGIRGGSWFIRVVYGLSKSCHMSGENLVKFHLGALDRVRES